MQSDNGQNLKAILTKIQTERPKIIFLHRLFAASAVRLLSAANTTSRKPGKSIHIIFCRPSRCEAGCWHAFLERKPMAAQLVAIIKPVAFVGCLQADAKQTHLEKTS